VDLPSYCCFEIHEKVICHLNIYKTKEKEEENNPKRQKFKTRKEFKEEYWLSTVIRRWFSSRK
jgi:predicted DNA repair protein MutK